MSLPSRERGLKSYEQVVIQRFKGVAPFAGAWIEIMYRMIQKSSATSLPSRERGLKFMYVMADTITKPVAPFAGAWIEIPRT